MQSMEGKNPNGIYENGSSALLFLMEFIFILQASPISVTTTCVDVYINFNPMWSFAELFKREYLRQHHPK